jgi:outer membrane protein
MEGGSVESQARPGNDGAASRAPDFLGFVAGWSGTLRGAMRFFVRVLLASSLLLSCAAHATSFANRGLGLGIGYMRIFADDPRIPQWAVPLWLEGSYYAESGFDVYLRVPIALAQVNVGAPTQSGMGLVVALGGQFGVRYLFLEESIRPFVSLHLSGLYVLRPTNETIMTGDNLLLGPGLGAGVEFFLSESISLQARGFFDWFIGINCNSSNCQRFSVGGTVTAATYF